MDLFAAGHATHPDWRMALSMAAAQVEAKHTPQAVPTLGFVYFSDHYAAQADALLAALRQRWPDVAWAGCVGVGVLASGVEYFDEPALVLLLASLPRASFRVFSGARPLTGFEAFSALVHADPGTPELAELLLEMSQRTASGYLFGGLAASRNGVRHVADGVWQGGLSGVAFAQDVALVSRVTQGCQPIGPVRRITAAEHNGVLALDGEPALRCLLRDLGSSLDEPRTLLPKLRATLVGLSEDSETMLARGAMFGTDTRVRHLVGVDPAHEVVAVADSVRVGMRLAFCSRDVQAARRDLVRICSEIREELSPDIDLAVAHATAQTRSPRRLRHVRRRPPRHRAAFSGRSTSAAPAAAGRTSARRRRRRRSSAMRWATCRWPVSSPAVKWHTTICTATPACSRSSPAPERRGGSARRRATVSPMVSNAHWPEALR
jgi:small ligand-binding sensory domain FIST